MCTPLHYLLLSRDEKNIAIINNERNNIGVVAPLRKKTASFKSSNVQQTLLVKETNIDQSFIKILEEKGFKHAIQIDGGFTFLFSPYKKSDIIQHKTETGFPSNYIGASYCLEFNSGFYFSAGFNYSRLKTKFELTDTIVWNQVMNEILTKRVNNAYTNEFITDLYEKIPVLKAREIRHYNHFNTLNIPITIGKQFQLNKLFYKIGVGASASLFSQSSGETLRDNEVIIYPASETVLYHNGMQLAAIAETAFGISVSQQLEIVAQIRYQKHLRDWSTDAIVVKPQSVLFGGGLKYNF